jgi:hypothetical protein
LIGTMTIPELKGLPILTITGNCDLFRFVDQQLRASDLPPPERFDGLTFNPRQWQSLPLMGC